MQNNFIRWMSPYKRNDHGCSISIQLKPHWSLRKYQHQLLTCQCILFQSKFAQEHHLCQKQPAQSPAYDHLISKELEPNKWNINYQNTNHQPNKQQKDPIILQWYICTSLLQLLGFHRLKHQAPPTHHTAILVYKHNMQQKLVSDQAIDRRVFFMLTIGLFQLCMPLTWYVITAWDPKIRSIFVVLKYLVKVLTLDYRVIGGLM